MKLRSWLMLGCAIAIPFGLAMRAAGFVRAGGWVMVVGGASLAFLFLLPAMGERAKQPSSATERRVTWGE